jgi:phosphatidate cytidylyltransferase
MTTGGAELTKRVAVAMVGIPLSLAAAYVGGYTLAALLAIMAAAGASELCRMYRGRGSTASPLLAGLLAAALVLMAAGMRMTAFVTVSTLLGLVAGSGIMLSAPSEARPGEAVVVTLFAAVYTGALLSFAVWIRELAGDRRDLAATAVLFLPVVVTWVGDTAAYFFGRTFGRHGFAPRISPKKTWEGAISGLIAAAGGAWLYVELTRDLVGWSSATWEMLAFGGAVGLAGQTGDLFESRFKRDCGVKDSSGLLPGHGGVLDRVDSLLFAFPVAFAYLNFVGV